MTWTKLSDDFADQCADLTDAAFRTHVEGLAWTMRRETGGRITERDLRRFAECDNPETAAAELVRGGYWMPDPSGWRIVHHMEYQPEPDVIARRRAMDAARQRRKRRKAAGLDTDTSRRDDQRDDPRDPGRDGAGRGGSNYSSNRDDAR